MFLVQQQKKGIDFGTADYNSLTASFLAKNDGDYLVMSVTVPVELSWDGSVADQPFRNIWTSEELNERFAAMTDRWTAVLKSMGGRQEIWGVRLSDRSEQLLWKEDYTDTVKVSFLGLLRIEQENSKYQKASDEVTGFFLDHSSLFLIHGTTIERIDSRTEKQSCIIENKSSRSEVSCQDHVIYYADTGCILKAYDYENGRYLEIPEIQAMDFYVYDCQVVYRDLTNGAKLTNLDLQTGEKMVIEGNVRGIYAAGAAGIYFIDDSRYQLYCWRKDSGEIERIEEEQVFFMDVVPQKDGDLVVYQTASQVVKSYSVVSEGH